MRIGCTDNKADDAFGALEIIKQLAPVVGGGGGGRADFAQAGGKDPTKLADAMIKADEIVRQIK